MEQNNWKSVWNKRDDRLDDIDMKDTQQVFLELKRLDGFDIADGGIPYGELLMQSELTKKNLCIRGGDSAFEVGCGSGANLYLLQKDGIEVGGIDYSDKLIAAQRKVFEDNDLRECICGEAIDCPVDIKYDAVFSNGVFQYFTDYNYAEKVLEKMLNKGKKSIGILDVYDIDKKEAYLEWRMKNVKDYVERYKNLPKLFYAKSFFEEFARKNNLEIKFVDIKMDGYWNNEFVFNCFMYK